MSLLKLLLHEVLFLEPKPHRRSRKSENAGKGSASLRRPRDSQEALSPQLPRAASLPAHACPRTQDCRQNRPDCAPLLGKQGEQNLICMCLHLWGRPSFLLVHPTRFCSLHTPLPFACAEDRGGGPVGTGAVPVSPQPLGPHGNPFSIRKLLDHEKNCQ